MSNSAPSCDCIETHEDIVAKVNEVMPNEELLYDLAELYKVFGDSTRIKILYLLRMRYCAASEHEHICDLTSAQSSQTGSACQVSPRWTDGVLCTCG